MQIANMVVAPQGPQGRNRKAQGVSPGKRERKAKPCKGETACAALAGLGAFRLPSPGLTPWALLWSEPGT